jgi:5'-nucleotidase/UDP-sugar diphosphatase
MSQYRNPQGWCSWNKEKGFHGIGPNESSQVGRRGQRGSGLSLILSWIAYLPLLGLTLGESWAAPLRIIHTNDLHSYFDHASDPTRGSYASLKAKIDELKQRSREEGIPTLVLDAGDFSEGSLFYLGKRGLNAWKMMNQMGYDAAVLGNHDWLMGSGELNTLLGLAPPNFVLATANFLVDSRLRNIEKTVQTHAEFEKAGLKIAVLGLTTNDFLYNWRVEDGLVLPPIRQAEDLLPWLRSKYDAVIALTHIGINEDIKLARKTAGIDVVVGGHSHTELKQPVFVKNQKGAWVPIVQTGEHGASLGNLVVDLEPGRPARVLSYQLEPIYVAGPHSEEVAQLATQARQDVESVYGKEWLAEVVGIAPEPLVIQKGVDPTYWSLTAAEAFRRSAKADLGLDVASMHGSSQPAGPVSRESIIRLYPRMFEMDRPEGWTVWSASIRGWVLKLAVEQIVARNIGSVTIAGVTYKKVLKNGRYYAKNIRFGGKPVYVLKDYRVAFPEGIVRGGIEIAEPIRMLFKFARDTKVPVWTSLAEQFKRQTQEP